MRRLSLLLVLLFACSPEFALAPRTTGRLHGRVVASGAPRAGVPVHLDTGNFAAVSHADGTWTMRSVPLGSYTVTAEVDDDADRAPELSASSPAEIGEGGEDVEVGDLDLQPAGVVSGRVLDDKGRPFPTAAVFLPGTFRSVLADVDGRYLLTGVPPGPRRISAAATGFTPASVAVELTPGEMRDGVDLVLAPDDGTARGALTGTVSTSEGALGVATVRAFKGNAIAAALATDGAFRLGPLPAGVYALRFDAPDHQTVTLPFLPLGSEDVDLGTILLEPGIPSPAGEVPQGAGPMTTAQLGAPRNLVGTPADGFVTLTWDAPEAGASSYDVYRTSDPAQAPTQLNTAPIADRFYVDHAVMNATAYYYRVTARRGDVTTRLEDAPLVRVVPGPGNLLVGTSGDRTLTKAQSPYSVVGGDLLVLPGQTLTIEPGVELHFESGRRLVVQGTLIARGTDAEPVVFTERVKDAGWAGLLIEDSAVDAVLDAKGEWVSGTVLEHTVIERSGSTGLTINAAAPLVARSEIRFNAQYTSASDSHGGGVRVGPGAAPVLHLCNIHHNSAGVTENDTTSSQWGAGLYSEGSPVLWENEISFNVLRAGWGANSSNSGAGVYLKGGQSVLSRNHFSGNTIEGSGQANTGQVMSESGLALAIADGAHRVFNNTFENHSLNADPGNMHGTVYVSAGTFAFVHNRVANNAIGDLARCAGIAVGTATVDAYLNVLEGNSLAGAQYRVTNGIPGFGTALYVGDARAVFRFNDFVSNTPNSYEIFNSGNLKLDLSSNYFSDTASTSVSARVSRPAYADLSDVRSARITGTGPNSCQADADCTALGGTQKCFWGGCMPACALVSCGAGMHCDEEKATCVAN